MRIDEIAVNFLYHGTTEDRISDIMKNGLTANNESDWFNDNLTKWLKDKIFLTTSEKDARYYALEMSKMRSYRPFILRVQA